MNTRSDTKLDEVKEQINERLDLDARVRAHPLAAVGLAFALGAVLAGIRRGSKRTDDAPKAGVSHAVFAGLGAIAMRLGRDYAIRRVARAAKGYMDQRGFGGSAQRVTSRDPGDSFARH